MRARALVALTIVWAIAAAAPASAQEGKKVLRLGQAQEPQTLSPFIDQDEEDFPHLVDLLRPARQLQPQGPRPYPTRLEALLPEMLDLKSATADHRQAASSTT